MKKTNKRYTKRYLNELLQKEHILRFEIESLKSELLFNDRQILRRIWNELRFVYDDIENLFNKKIIEQGVYERNRMVWAVKEELEQVHELQKYKMHLVSLNRSPFMLLVWAIKSAKYAFSVYPRLMQKYEVRRELQTKKKKRVRDMDIIILGASEFKSRMERVHYLANGLSGKGHRVFYIQPRFITSKRGANPYEVTKHGSGVYVVQLQSPHAFDITYQEPSKHDLRTIQDSFKSFCNDSKLSVHAVVKVDHPFWGEILRKCAYPVIYDIPGSLFELSKSLLKRENNIAKSALALVSESKELLKRLKKKYPKKSMVIANGTDYARYSPASVKADTCTVGLCWIKQPVIGCIGANDDVIDVKLLSTIATVFPTASIVLEGKIESKAFLKMASKHPHIFLIGEKPGEILPKFIQTFDLCFMPFKEELNRLDHHTLYDYLSAGKPVVTTTKPENKKLLKHIYFAPREEQFIKLMRYALKEKGTKKLMAARQKVAKENEWGKRVAQLEKIMKKMVNNQ